MMVKDVFGPLKPSSFVEGNSFKENETARKNQNGCFTLEIW